MRLIISIYLISWFSFTGDLNQTTMGLDMEQQKAKVSYLALGDSYTIGESVEQSERWPVQLVHKLRSSGVAIKDPEIVAKTGWTTDELIDAIDQAELKPSYDLVTLLIGVNNQYRGYPIDQQKKEFEILLKKAIEFAGNDTSRVFVVSIPDYGVTPFAEGKDREQIGKEIDVYNTVNFEICKKYGVAYFDITPISRKAATNDALTAGDGLHPSGEMYAQWVEVIHPLVEETLVE